MSQFIVGLTGGIGSGKSTVADQFVALGATLVDTDRIAHALTAPQGAAMPALIAAFGKKIINTDGALDRSAMRQIAFSDPAAKARLENILHPMIRNIAAEQCAQAETPYVILAVPLLVEAKNYRERCHRIAVVDCPESLQIFRVMQRNNLSEMDVRRIMENQASRSMRLSVADDVIENTGDLSSLFAQTKKLHALYLELAGKNPQAKC